MGVNLLAFILYCFAFQKSQAAPPVPREFTVVIDPGHGGSDTGAIYTDGKTRVQEKDLTLLLSLKVAEQLRARGLKAILTRQLDADVALPERTAIANRLRAQVFLSIHLNSGANGTTAEGVETYILSHSTDQSTKRLADLENKVLEGSEAKKLSETTDPNVSLIVKDLMLDANREESQELACLIQNRIVQATTGINRNLKLNPKNRGVREGLFYVLLGADMPAVLLEAGFITHTKDRYLLQSPSGQNKLASSIATAIIEYKRIRKTPKARTKLSECKFIGQSEQTPSPSPPKASSSSPKSESSMKSESPALHR